MIFRFIGNFLTRFAKTFGCVFFIAGLGVAGWLHQERSPMIDSARYSQSSLISERLRNLESTYSDSQQLVMRFKGTAEFPREYAAAAFKPQFPQSFSNIQNFESLRAQLAQASSGKEAMKQLITARFDALLAEIQQKLLSHAASIAPSSPSVPVPRAPLKPTALPDFGLFEPSINNFDINSRKSTLDDAMIFLGKLKSSAENPENKQKLADSIAEIESIAKILPSNIEPASNPEVPKPAQEPREPLKAEKVASGVEETRKQVKAAVLSSWALDKACDLAIQAADAEQQRYLDSEFRVNQLTQDLHLMMAAAITLGTVFGLLFLLIGDWTQKSSTEVLFYSRELIEDFKASPKEVYELVEKSIESRKVPGLESKRAFWHEGGALSSKREYLQLSRERLLFEICAAPFGTGFFVSFRTSVVPLVIDPLAIFLVLLILGLSLLALVSSFGLLWGGIILVFSLCALIFTARTAIARGLADVDRVLMKTPLFAPLYELFLRPITYYRIDSTQMYQIAVQSATSEAFEKIFGEQKVALLTKALSAPVMEGIFTRRIY